MLYREKQTWYSKLYYKTYDTANAILLCIKYPFLYPRDYSTDKHKTIWKLDKFLLKEYKKAYNISEKSKVNLGSENSLKIHSYYHFWIYNIIQFYYDYICQLIYCIPTDTLLDDMPPGWRKAFGIQMCKDIKKTIIKYKGYKSLIQYRVYQIKEKFGGLSWYDNMSFSELNDIIRKYENISYNTCISCGNPATYITTGWISPYCDNCLSDSEKAKAKKIK